VSLAYPIHLVHAGPGSAAVIILPDGSLHAAAVSAVYGLYRTVAPGQPVAGITAEPAVDLCGTIALIPRFRLDQASAWRESAAKAVEQIVDVRCVHIVFEPLMPPDYLCDLVRRTKNAANRIVVFCTLANYEGSDLARMRDVQVFSLLNPIH